MQRLSMQRLSMLIAIVALLGEAGDAAVQDYPWCSNFADGWGGTNCGFTTKEQCMATILGSGGFCAPNNMYKAPAATAVPSPRPSRERRSRSNS